MSLPDPNTPKTFTTRIVTYSADGRVITCHHNVTEVCWLPDRTVSYCDANRVKHRIGYSNVDYVDYSLADTKPVMTKLDYPTHDNGADDILD